MITLVSALHPDLRADWDVGDWQLFTKQLCGLGLPLVLHVAPSLREVAASTLSDAHPTAAIRALPDGDASSGMWLDAQFRASAAGAELDERSAACLAISLRALGWLHDESIFNPFGVERFVWLDPGVASQLNPAHLQSAALDCFGRSSTRLVVLDRAEDDAAFCPHPLLLAGSAAVLSALNSPYWHLYARMIEGGQLPRPDALLTALRDTHPDSFARFRLQSNGLPSAFFDAVRAGRALLEYELLRP